MDKEKSAWISFGNRKVPVFVEFAPFDESDRMLAAQQSRLQPPAPESVGSAILREKEQP